MLDKNVVALDMPGFAPPDLTLDQSASDIDARILMANEIKRWSLEYVKYVANNLSGEPPKDPNRDLKDYKDQSLNRSDRIQKGLVTGLFGTAVAGDLVVVPDKLDTRKIHIAEITGEARSAVKFPERYWNEELPARPVKWLTAADELLMPKRLTEVVRSVNAFSLLPQDIYDQIFDAAYGTYQIGGKSTAAFVSGVGDYDNEDSLSLSLMGRLSSLVSDHAGPATKLARLSAVLDAPLPPDQEILYSISIQSPGAAYLSSHGIAPLVMAALLALCATAGAEGMPSPNDVNVINSRQFAGVDDARCTSRVEESVRRAMDRIGRAAWIDLCRRQAELEAGPRIQGPARAARREGGEVPSDEGR